MEIKELVGATILVLHFLTGIVIVFSYYIEKIMDVCKRDFDYYPSIRKVGLASVCMALLPELIFLELKTKFKLWERRE